MQKKTDKLLRLKDVLARIPVSRTTWFCGIRAGHFPKSVSLGGRAVAWRESEINHVVAGTWKPDAAEVAVA